MLQVKKKTPRTSRHGRRWMLLCAVALLAGCVAAYGLLRGRSAELPERDHSHDGGVIASHQAEEVVRLSVTTTHGAWTLLREAGGGVTLENDEDFEVDEQVAEDLFSAVQTLAYEEMLSDDPAEFQDHLADFGLETPMLRVEVAYTDGSAYTLTVGDELSREESGYHYMQLEGDPRLLTMDLGTMEALMLDRGALHPVTQPTLHKARFDRITFRNGQGDTLAEWALQGGIGGNAQDRWMLVQPVRYPADGDSIANLQSSLANLRLGGYVGAATPENLTAYGFDEPRFVLEIHQAAGATGTLDEDGVYGVTDWPESTFTFTVGGAKSDMVDYVLVDGSIYVSSHFLLEVFMDMDVKNSVSRYTVPVALGNLSRLTVESGGDRQDYSIIRNEQVAENNALITDSEGQVQYDLTCELNGQAIPYASFEAAYNELLKVTVSGWLPEGWAPAEAPHTTFTFEAVDGETHTLALTAFDTLHDAVTLDGCTLFYLIRDGMAFRVEQE